MGGSIPTMRLSLAALGPRSSENLAESTENLGADLVPGIDPAAPPAKLVTLLLLRQLSAHAGARLCCWFVSVGRTGALPIALAIRRRKADPPSSSMDTQRRRVRRLKKL